METILQCTLLKKNKDMNYWTHFSFRRFWFTRKASLSARTPSSLIRFPLRLQNVREQEMRGGSTNLFTLCTVYLVSAPHWVHKLQMNSIIKLESSSSIRSRVTLSQDKQYSWDMQCYARLNVWSWAWVLQGLVNSKAVHLDVDLKLFTNYCSF